MHGGVGRGFLRAEGGLLRGGGGLLDDLWEWDSLESSVHSSGWRALSNEAAGGLRPRPRRAHSCGVWGGGGGSGGGGALIITGGIGAAGVHLNDAWSFSFSSLEWCTTPYPHPLPPPPTPTPYRHPLPPPSTATLYPHPLPPPLPPIINPIITRLKHSTRPPLTPAPDPTPTSPYPQDPA